MSKTNFIKLNDVRLSFPSLFTPKVWKDSASKPKYEASFILDKKIHKIEIDLINAKINELLELNKLNINKIKTDHMCLKDGDLFEREEYQNKYVIKTKSLKRVPLVDKDAVTPIAEGDNILYAGCYVSAYINLFCYNDKAIGIGANLKSLQFRKDGTSFEGQDQDIRGAYDPVEDESEGDIF